MPLEDATYRRLIQDLEVFSVGTHTDSQGYVEEFRAEDLDHMVEAFDAGAVSPVPLKLGHSSDEFNQQVASALNVPEEAVKGDNGEGQIALGRVLRLRRAQNKLLADVEIADELAEMVERGLLQNVSAELSKDEMGMWVMTGLALLGAERPAVENLNGLAAAAILTAQKQPVRSYTWERPAMKVVDRPDESPNTTVSGGPQTGSRILAALRDIVRRFESDAPAEGEGNSDAPEGAGEKTMIDRILKRLGFAEDTEDGDAVEQRLDRALKAEERATTAEQTLRSLAYEFGLISEDTDEAYREADPDAGQFREAARKFKASGTRDYAALQEDNRKLRERVDSLEMKDRRAAYREETRKFSAIEGTPDELADELIRIEDALGKDAATKRVGEWEKMQEYAEQAGITRRFGQNGSGDDGGAETHSFEKKTREYQDANGVTWEAALARMAQDDPAGFADYRAFKASEAASV